MSVSPRQLGEATHGLHRLQRKDSRASVLAVGGRADSHGPGGKMSDLSLQCRARAHLRSSHNIHIYLDNRSTRPFQDCIVSEIIETSHGL